MRLIERYLLRQLVGPTVLATAALGMVALLGAVLGNLDLIGQGQNPIVLVELSLLAMPQLMALIIMPIALFVAALVALNRLQTEQELVVCFASGMSRWRVVSPAVRLAVIAALISLAANLWIAPLADRAMRQELFHVRTDLAASLIHVGQFTQPAPGLTVYAQESDQTGTFHNLFVFQEKADGGDTTYIAARGKIAKRGGVPVLILRDGSSQFFSPTGVLNYLTFDDHALDLSQFASSDELVHYKIADRYLHELLFPDLTQAWERDNRRRMLAEANARLALPLYNIAFVALALWAVIGGGFSRLGYGGRIAVVCVIAAVARILGIGAQAACAGQVWLNILQYAIPIATTGWAFADLFRPLPTRARRAFGGAAALIGRPA